MAATVQLRLLVAMFQAMSRDRAVVNKRGRLQAFLDRTYGASSRDDYFRVLHLFLPGLDCKCDSHGLKEVDLVATLVDALGIAKDSPNTLRLTSRNRSGNGCNIRNFAFVAAELLQQRQGMTSSRLMIKEVNDPLDRITAT